MDHGQGVSGVNGLGKLLTSALLVTLSFALGVDAPRAQDAETTATVFRDHISGPIVQSKCIFCHVEGGRSGHTRLVFVRESDASDHEELNLQAFIEFLDADDSHERILAKIQGVSHGGGQQVPASSDDFEHMDRFLALLGGQTQGLIERLLGQLDEGEPTLMFGITTPTDGDAVSGNAVTISAAGASTPAVHFAYRSEDVPDAEFAYAGAAANRSAAWLAWDSSGLMDGDYELAALYTVDGGDSITYDTIEVAVDNVDPAAPPDIVENDGQKTQALRTGTAYEVITADGVVVTVPAGALGDDDRITITVLGQPDPATAPGDVVGIGIDIALTSGRDTFSESVTVGIPYPEGKPDGLVDHTTIPEVGLSLWLFDLQTDAWALIPGSMVQPDADMVVADVVQTGEFGIFNAPLLRLEQDGEGITSLDFGTEATASTFTVVNGNAASEPLTWTIDPPDPSWLSVEPDRGGAGSEAGTSVMVSVDRTGLEPGDYTGTLHVRSNGGLREVSVSIRVPAPPGSGCAALLAPSGTPPDPTLMGLLGLVTVYLVYGRRRPRCQVAAV